MLERQSSLVLVLTVLSPLFFVYPNVHLPLSLSGFANLSHPSLYNPRLSAPSGLFLFCLFSGVLRVAVHLEPRSLPFIPLTVLLSYPVSPSLCALLFLYSFFLLRFQSANSRPSSLLEIHVLSIFASVVIFWGVRVCLSLWSNARSSPHPNITPFEVISILLLWVCLATLSLSTRTPLRSFLLLLTCTPLALLKGTVIWLIRWTFDPPRRTIFFFWLLLLLVCLPTFALYLLARPLVDRHVARKYFHFVAIAIALAPLVANELPFAAVAFTGAFFLFVAVEVVKKLGLLVGGEVSTALFHKLLDERDRGVMVTHIHLLVGTCLPIVLESFLSCYGQQCKSYDRGAALQGVLAVGLGDSAAAIVGRRWGRHTFSLLAARKTLEGLAAFFVAYLAGAMILAPWAGWQLGWTRVVVSAAASACFEAMTSEIDNFLLPSFSYALMKLMA